MKQVTIETVRERMNELGRGIASGRISLREEFELACLRALVERMEGVDDDVRNVVALLENNEWAEHCTDTELGQRLESEITRLYNWRSAQPAPVVPEGLNPETTDLVLRFASALADKLYKAEQKYGRSTDWMKDDWYDDCLQSLWEHIEKGDPRDVAAYCAFMWYHGWVTTDYDRNVQNACRAAMLQDGDGQPVTGNTAQQFEALATSEAPEIIGYEVRMICGQPRRVPKFKDTSK